MTTEEIKRALQCCVGINGGCDDCPCRHTYYEEDNCRQIMIDAHNAIGELEERIAIMQESMGALEKRCNALDALEQRCKTLDALDDYETARLMTWEEVVKVAEYNDKAPQDEQQYVWAEEQRWSLCEIAKPEVYQEQIITLFPTGDECGWDCSDFDYNRVYRCWTNRPTKDQRSVKWDD